MNWRIIFIAIVLMACKQKQGEQLIAGTSLQAKQELLKEDLTFSEMCKNQGYRKAFLDYLDTNSVMIKPNAVPLASADIVNYLTGIDDKAFRLKWEPHFAEVAASGDLGYTYGVYQISDAAEKEKQFGNYVHIWKKRVGKWKLAFHGEMPGLDDQSIPKN